MKKVTKWILILTVGTGWLVVLPKVHAQNPTPTPTKEIGFTVTDPNLVNEVGRDKTYDYSPSVLEENGETKVYVCGGGVPDDPYAGHDAIYLTVFNSSGVKTIDSKRVLSPLISNLTSDDAVHACAPTVIKHSFSQLENGKEKYLMYYECAPKVWRRSDGAEIDTFTQICVAFSDDGVNWQKYNEDIWSSQFRFANANEPPTPVIKINPLMAAKYGIRKTNGQYWTDFWTPSTPDNEKINSYGVGHPSALVRNGQIWLYYYDSVGDWGNRGVFLTKSWDGFHFETPIKITDLKSPVGDVKYVNSAMGSHSGFFVDLVNGMYNYSWNGINWGWTEIDTADFFPVFLANNYSMKNNPPAGQCLSPGGWTIAGDKFGTVNSASVNIFMNEGKRGVSDGCTATNGCTCYSQHEDQSRGYTWQTYMYKGKFTSLTPPSPTPTPKPGDLNGDTHIDNTDYQFFVADFGKTGSPGFIPADINGDGKVDIFDYNVLVENFGK